MLLKGARQAIHDALALHLTGKTTEARMMAAAKLGIDERGTRVPDNDYRIVDLLEAGRILSVIDRQPAHVQDWAYYAYSPIPDHNKRDALADWIFNIRYQSHPSRKHPSIRRLLRVAIDDQRNRVANGRTIPKVTIYALICIQQQNWKRDGHAQHWREIGGILSEYDRRAVVAVAEELRHMRDRDDD